MAIVQISQITQRKGLQENLPQLAGAEFGWSIDTRQLFIGNGTLQEGAPVIGNTEILTEFSDILNFNTTYIYKGNAAGYTAVTGPAPGEPVVQSLQSWLDQWASVKDFGAVGDGITDDTAAINRALFQLYCREINPQIRRSLFFPAGVYRVTDNINIPPYATLYGEGIEGSVIQLDNGITGPVARTADSLQQTNGQIGINGAIPPQYITITNMGFSSLDPNQDIFLIEDATNIHFQNVSFVGPLLAAGLTTDTNQTTGIAFASTVNYPCNQITLDGCKFSGTTWGVTTDNQASGVTISNSRFDTLYTGIELGTGSLVNGGPNGFRIVHNFFDNIYAEGVVIGAVSLNATGHNIFYNVGNHFGTTTTPYTAVIDIQSANNVSISDMFQRADAQANTVTPGTSYPRVTLNNTQSIATTNGTQLAMGTFVRESGLGLTLVDNTSSPAAICTVNNTVTVAFAIDYTITRNVSYRTGRLTVASGTGLTTSDDYVENSATGITLSVSQVGSNVIVSYTSSSTGVNGAITYSIAHLA